MKFDLAIELLQTEMLSLKAVVRKVDKISAEAMTHIPVARELDQIRELSEAIEILRADASREGV